MAQIEKTAGHVARIEEKKARHREEAPEAPEVKSMQGYYLRGIVPGWGQVYAGSEMKGYIYAGTFVATGLFWAVAHLNYTDKKQAYDDLPYGTTGDKFDSAHDAYKKAGIMAYAAMGLVGLAYAANWVDILFFTKPRFGTAAAANSESGVFIGFDAVNRHITGSYRLEEFYELSMGMRF